MRTITTHKINGVNDGLTINVLDEPGAGGASHLYQIVQPDGTTTSITFQNGGIADVGVNGITHEALLAIVLDRLEAFQAGPNKCAENSFARMGIADGLSWLKQRTQNRLDRGVEGTTKP